MSNKPTMYQVDAFTSVVFKGNPAAVMALAEWPADERLLAIASENNLSETAFVRPAAEDDYDFELRWFTPAAEVDLCGHATLATAHVLFQHLGFAHAEVKFMTRSGLLSVSQQNDGMLVMDFPAATVTPVAPPKALLRGLKLADERSIKVYQSYDYIAVLATEQAVQEAQIDLAALSELDGRGVLITAAGEQHDFVSRCFFPKLNVNEDPVTGSAHCELTPLWAQRLGKTRFSARQLSPRGGDMECELVGDRVILRGRAVTYMQATLHIDM